MAVLKYSDLADSGLYVKTSTKGVANGVASLDSNGKVPVIQLPEGVGGGVAGVSSFNGRTGAVTLTAGDVSGLVSASSTYSFKVTFNNSDPASVSEVPSGWNVSLNGSQVTVTHTVGSMPKFVSYLGYNTGTYRYRTPTSFDELVINEGTKNTSFYFALTNTVAGSQLSGHAYVNVSF